MYAAGQWIVNLNYWGCNQYITQRALGADLKTARTGILFAAMLKLMMPIIVMLPGIAAYVLNKAAKRCGGRHGWCVLCGARLFANWRLKAYPSQH